MKGNFLPFRKNPKCGNKRNYSISDSTQYQFNEKSINKKARKELGLKNPDIVRSRLRNHKDVAKIQGLVLFYLVMETMDGNNEIMASNATKLLIMINFHKFFSNLYLLTPWWLWLWIQVANSIENSPLAEGPQIK